MPGEGLEGDASVEEMVTVQGFVWQHPVCPFFCPTDPQGASCDVPQMGVAKESTVAHEIQS